MPTTLICPMCKDTEINSGKDLFKKPNDNQKGYSADELIKHLKEKHNCTDLGGALICPECSEKKIYDAYSAEKLFKHLKEKHNYADIDSFVHIYNGLFVEN